MSTNESLRETSVCLEPGVASRQGYRALQWMIWLMVVIDVGVLALGFW